MVTTARHTRTLRSRTGAALAVAAVLALTACGTEEVSGGSDPEPTASSPDNASPSATAPSPSAPESPGTATSAPRGEPFPVMYLGASPRGRTVLFAENAPLAGRDVAGVLPLLARTPLDPDYRTLWTPDMLRGATESDGVVTVDLTPAASAAPAGASRQDATMSLRQMAWTFKGLGGASAVRFTVDGAPAGTVLGVPVTGPVKADKPARTLSLMQVLVPAEGQVLTNPFTASGTSNGFEASVGWQLLDGDTVVKDGFGTAEGWMDKNYPWSVDLDLTGVPAGTYTLKFSNDDPSDGEGSGPDTDTRTVVVE